MGEQNASPEQHEPLTHDRPHAGDQKRALR
jgi:hypothetical protein